ncbi:MAG: hypothetical protein KF802_06795 [Bdellovibrionaceae bacterium]|nr:hypothetical protein [Pseudobdellovibrionaceae bacterium]MBX3034387.1 hypothetical protein [Pseudobdellovibrionaceae bacterium]
MFKPALALLLFSGAVARAEFSFDGELFLALTRSSVVSPSLINPGNRLLEEPLWNLGAEFRPQFQYRTEKTETVLRTRHFFDQSRVELRDPSETRDAGRGRSDISDAFFAWSVSDHVNTTLGLQNYQWGPAEIASPSNVFFHFNNDQRSFFYKEKGKVLARVSWFPREDVTVLGIYEPVSNRDPHWVEGREFSPQSALKIEKQFGHPMNSFALVLGRMEEDIPYVAEHFSWMPWEGFSLYGDLRHQEKNLRATPWVDNAGFVRFRDGDVPPWSTYGVVGFRHEGRVDFRQEFIFQQAGYSQEEWDLIAGALGKVSPFLPRNFAAFGKPGLELRSKAYSYTSLRIPDLGDSPDVSAAVRWLADLERSSSALQLNYERNAGDSLVLSAEATVFFGESDTEFTFLKSNQVSVGARYSF